VGDPSLLVNVVSVMSGIVRHNRRCRIEAGLA
jgi:hypothetical protein